MRSMLTYVQEIVPYRVSAVDRLSPKKRLVAVTTVDTTAALVLPVTLGSTRITLMDSEKSATVTEQAVQLTTESASLPESGWDVSKPLNPIVYRISGSATN